MGPDWSEMREMDGRAVLADTVVPSRTWMDAYILPEDRPAVQAAIDAAIRSKGRFELERRLRHADGTVGWA